MELLEPRTLLAADFGDAPDLGAGTGTGDYETLQANGGPSHTTDVTQFTLFLGDNVDSDAGTLQNTAANADDVNGALPDDEDGVLYPLQELVGTVGASPKITLLATNNTGSAATLSGWIDYNRDGVFDNASERAQLAVPNGTTDGRFSLTFPAIPAGSAGATYARFRLSTDAAASNPTGAATDGEVEDYQFAITNPSDGSVQSQLKISDGLGGLTANSLESNDNFGSAVANLGDLDGDGVADLAVGARTDENIDNREGAVYVLFLNVNGSVKSQVKISDGIGGLAPGTLGEDATFGTSVASLGDLDGDGVTDLAVGAEFDENTEGAVYLLLLNADGTVKGQQKISDGVGGLAANTLAVGDSFGSAVASLGDLDGDGVGDMVAGANRSRGYEGAVYVLLLNSDGTVKSQQEISDGVGGLPADTLVSNGQFGTAVASLGDLDGDSLPDIAVGARASASSAVHILFLNADGTVKSNQEISDGVGGLAANTLSGYEYFGSGVAHLGDVDGDGIGDLAVGARGDENIDNYEGAVYTLLLNADGTVKAQQKISDGLGGLAAGTLDAYDGFGSSVSSLGDLDGDGVTDLAVGAVLDENGDSAEGAVYILRLSAPPVDYGDAPDTGAGTGTGNYETLAANGGPSHSVVPELFLGDTADGDAGTLQNTVANADDVDGALPDDEDGVLYPLQELIGTVGTQPTITLLATNTTGSAATLSGWIDYNNDGVFDNVTERAQAAVPDGTIDGHFTLTFPAIPNGSAGESYARFRLSTDSAAENPTGAASDGEVEDYRFAITNPSGVTTQSQLKISDGTGGLAPNTLDAFDAFGTAVAALGDLDGDGVADIAVGAEYDENGDSSEGAVYILFLNADGTVKSQQKISDGVGGLAPNTLDADDTFGSAVTNLGDLDGDGVTDIAVGAHKDQNGDYYEGAVFVLLLNSDGSVKSQQKISDGLGGLAANTLEGSDNFGSAVSGVGDLDGDGIADLIVGAEADENGDSNEGAIYVLLLNADGTVKSQTKISDGLGGLAANSLDGNDRFGSAIANLGDLDDDGFTDIAVGARQSAGAEGAVYILLLNGDGTVKSQQKIADGTGGLANNTLVGVEQFGAGVGAAGDLDGDGVSDLVVGAYADENGNNYEGAVYILLLNSDGTLKSQQKISDDLGGLAANTLETNDSFGTSVAVVGDLNGDGLPEIAVGARGDENGDSAEGAIYILSLSAPSSDFGDAPAPYPTTLAEDGARHTPSGLTLGSERDAEDDGTHSANADADDTTGGADDEDGVTFGTIQVGDVDAMVTVNVQGSAGKLDAWIDFDGDGSWGGAGEKIFDSVDVNVGDNFLTFAVPSWAKSGPTYARFRLSTVGNLSFVGAASDGEVEDYLVTIVSPLGSGVLQASGQALANIAESRAVVTGDFDGDDDLDVFIVVSSGNHQVWLNNAGTFTNSGQVLTNAAISSGAALGDVDGDGDLDAFVINQFGNHQLWINTAGVFTPSGQTLTNSAKATHVEFGDLDGDGDLDAFISVNKANHQIWVNTGGVFALSGQTLGNSVSGKDIRLGDLDGDGDLDAFVIGKKTNHQVWINTEGTFALSGQTLSNSGNAQSVQLGDLDGDGDLDAFVAINGGNQQIWINTAGVFLLSAQLLPNSQASTSVRLGDLDGDGDLDAFVTNKFGGHQVWINTAGIFSLSAQPLPNSLTAKDAALGDFDGDGDLDVFVVSLLSDHQLWSNVN